MNKTDSQARSYYDDFAGWYERERHSGYHALLDDLQLDIIKPLAQGNVLEVGCGTGLLMRGIESTCDSLTGMDISPGMLQKSKERGFHVVRGSATALPFEDNTFDLVYSFKVLAHVNDIKGALEEMKRVTKPGGYFVADFYNRFSLRHLAKRIASPGQISENRTEDEMFTRWDTPSQARAHLPDEINIIGWRGVRVFTPMAEVYRLPVVGKIFKKAEHLALSSPLSRFGGFLTAVCQKKE